jgi:hypothetical protein
MFGVSSNFSACCLMDYQTVGISLVSKVAPPLQTPAFAQAQWQRKRHAQQIRLAGQKYLIMNERQS